jgi:hypothetical protein
MKFVAPLVALFLLFGLAGRPHAQEPLKDFSIRYQRRDDYRVPHSWDIVAKTPGAAGELSLVAQPDEVVAFENSFRGMRVLLVNRAEERAAFMGQYETLKLLVQEALDKDGQWKLIEREGDFGGCGTGMRGHRLQPGQYWAITAPRYTGSFKTKLRFRLRVCGPLDVVYSEEFEGSVNPEQFRSPEPPTPKNEKP